MSAATSSAVTSPTKLPVSGETVEVVHEPKMTPLNNRAARFRDPEGTLVGMYTPITDAARKRFGGRS